MERKAVLVSVGVVAIAAVAWFTFRPTGRRVGSLRVVPPAPGECVGRVEATVVNGTTEAVRVGRLIVLQNGHRTDSLGNRFPGGHIHSGGEDPWLVTFGEWDTWDPITGGPITLEAGASRVLVADIFRVRDWAKARVSIQGAIHAEGIDGMEARLTTPPVDVDPAAWPQPVAVGPEALDRALDEGHDLSILLEEAGMPKGPRHVLQIGPSGRMQGGRNWAWRWDEKELRAVGRLTPEQQASLRAAVRSAPFSTFRVGPQWVYDGRQVRILVVAGSTAFAGDAQEEEFVAAGLGPLLEHLRLLRRDLLDAGGGR